MVKYSYRAITNDGREKKGTMIADNHNSLISKMREQGVNVYSYKQISKKNVAVFKKLSTADLIAFSTQLSQMLVAGLSLGTSLQMLYERTEKGRKNLKKTYAYLFEQVQKGKSLSEGMIEMGNCFPNLYISMVKSGQLSGKLDQTLVELADHFDKRKKQQNLIRSAMTYPIILLIVTFLVVIILSTAVLPNIIKNLPDGTSVPAPTKILLGIKNFLVTKWHIAIIIVFTGIVLHKICSKTNYYKEGKGKLLVNIPKIGKLNKMRYTAAFASSLSTLYSVGVNLLDAIAMAGEILPNLHITRQIAKANIDIRKGVSIADAFSKIDSFDPLLTTMIFVGEQSGSLGDILKKTSAYFDEEATTAVKGLTAMLQPAMLVIMAVVVGFVLIAVMLPMFASYNVA